MALIFFVTCPRYVKAIIGINIDGSFYGYYSRTTYYYSFHNSNEFYNEINKAINNDRIDVLIMNGKEHYYSDISCNNFNNNIRTINIIIIIKIGFIIGLLAMIFFFEDKMIYCKILNYVTVFLLLACIFTNLTSMSTTESFRNMLSNDAYIIKGTLWGEDIDGNITQTDITITNLDLLNQICIATRVNYKVFMKFCNYTKISNFDVSNIFDICFLILASITSFASIFMRMVSCKGSYIQIAPDDTIGSTGETIDENTLEDTQV